MLKQGTIRAIQMVHLRKSVLAINQRGPHSTFFIQNRHFATKNDDGAASDSEANPSPVKTEKKVARGRPQKVAEQGSLSDDKPVPVPPRRRRTKFEINAAKMEAELLKVEKKPEDAEGVEGAESKKPKKKKVNMKPQTMYTLKFNSPILPYAKFPLTQNKYIQDFLRSYEEDKEKITKVIGVHFEKNSNSNAENAVGIEIEIIKKNNITIIESNNNNRYKVLDYNATTNFSQAVPFLDDDSLPLLQDPNENDQRYKDLLMSEIFELKNTWFLYNKKINSILVILPQEILNRYDMVAKSLQPPTFDMGKYPTDARFIDIFDEITYKMAQYYFSVFQAIFSKDNESVRPMIADYLKIQDPIHRSRKIISYFEELHGIIDKKLYYVQKMADEFKERSKTNLLEHAYQRVLEDTKKSDKSKFQEKLDEVKNMDDSIRKVLQEEIDGLDAKNDTESARKVQYLNQVFRLPWDKQVTPVWDVQYSAELLDKTHYGMQDTKDRILEFIAKNKRINSQTGMVLLLTGPPGVGKTSIAKSIGECLQRPTTVISMGGQNDPIHIKGSKRTYVDSQPGIFVKELQRLEVKNPVIVIDEIDKVGMNSLKGDVSSTLLELLNPEQANQFRDNYLDIEFDFSQVIFICTSNSNRNMLGPLLDRIEVINVPAYLPVEKMNIAKNYLIPKFEKEYGFNEGHQSHEKIQLTDASIMEMINQYCGYEAGVRNLRKCIDRVFRKIVAKLERQKLLPSEVDAATPGHLEHSEETLKEYQVNTKNLSRFLDVSPTDDTYYQGINKQLPTGSSNGLAYVDDGYGAMLKIQFVKREYGKFKPSEEKEAEGMVTHTGRLGDVMKESLDVVKIAVFNYIQEHKLNDKFDKEAYHLHVPMGATPKDGPSAGTSLFAALMSIATNTPVGANLAMTGEITTLGEVISIGGVREKLTACKNHQVTRVILPLSNKKNVSKLPEEFMRGFTVFYVTNIDQLYNICFKTDPESVDYSHLHKLGVEIEMHDKDRFMEEVINCEQIAKDNLIEQLK